MQSAAKTLRPSSVTPYPLGEIISEFGLASDGASAQISVTGVTINSRDVAPGDLYVALPGSKRHGAEFARSALEQGAVAILTDRSGADMLAGVGAPVLMHEQNPRLILGRVASMVYQSANPERKIFGITGTNGKTSVVYMLDALARAAGYKTGISTTAERRIGDTAIESDLTSPEATELHALLSAMSERDVSMVGIEVSAQAVVRHRIDGVLFDVVAFNNFSQDHLDDFGDMETYFKAKVDLFVPERAVRGVIVVDGPHGQRLRRLAKIPVTTLSTTYGQEADWHMAMTAQSIDGVSFVLQGPEGAYFRGRVPLMGGYMAENAALALIMLHEAGVPLERVAAGLENGEIPVGVPGRMELLTSRERGPRFYIDYAHTPGSFEAILDGLQEVAPGRIIFMFGADGDRDTTKREEMGRIASAGSDVLIVCDYHPRFEDPAGIRRQLIAGARSALRPAEIHEIPDPREAIRFALSLAGESDTIVYAGPGHESYMEVAGNMIEYSARDEVRVALREAGLLN